MRHLMELHHDEHDDADDEEAVQLRAERHRGDGATQDAYHPSGYCQRLLDAGAHAANLIPHNSRVEHGLQWHETRSFRR